jgi:gamma-glutamyl phosphate reductase
MSILSSAAQRGTRRKVSDQSYKELQKNLVWYAISNNTLSCYETIVTKSEREMKEMMKSLEKYVRKKKLELNAEKTKMMVFNKRKRKSEENEWNWEERKINGTSKRVQTLGLHIQ